MEKSSIEIFDENYEIIKENIACAAKKSGRKFEDITLLAATKTVDISVINHAISSGISYIRKSCSRVFIKRRRLFAGAQTFYRPFADQ